MKPCIRFFTLLLFPQLFFVLISRGQNADLLNFMPTIAPASPTASGFTAYGQIPFDNNDGSFSYQVPIFSVNFRDIPVSVALGYQGSGVLIDEVGGTVGTNWNLLAGGTITRVMRGIPDEQASQRWYPSQLDINRDYGLIETAAAGTTVDTEQDWFSFNVNGLSGRFYLDENLNIISSGTNDEKIEMQVTSNTSNYGNILKFVITDSKGYQYIFGESTSYVEFSLLTRDCYVGPKPRYQSAWFLKEIVSPSNARISFEYINYELDLLTSMVYNRLYYKTCLDGNSLSDYMLKIDRCRYYTHSTTRALSRINMGNDAITFTYDAGRLDGGGLKLTQMQLTRQAEVLKNVNLIYDEVMSTKPIQNPDIQALTNLKYRYFLTQVNFSGTASSFRSNYSFEYYDKEQLPPRFSYSRDKFGYFNDRPNTSVYSGKIKDDEALGDLLMRHGGTAFSSADHEVNPAVVHYGLLRKIVYPTGGHTTVTYEANRTYGWSNVRIRPSGVIPGSLSCAARESTHTMQFVSNGGQVSYQASVNYDDRPGTCTPAPDPIHDLYTVRLIDLSNNTMVHSTTRKVSETLEGSGISTINGRSYEVQFILTSKFNALIGGARITFNETVSRQRHVKYAGANRVRFISDVGSTGDVNGREFYYNLLANIDSIQTSLNDIYEPKLFDVKNTLIDCFPGMRESVTYNISSSNLNQLYGFRNGAVNYGAITEKYVGGGSANNGYEERKYIGIADAPGRTEYGSEVLGLPYSNFSEGVRGKLISRKLFNAEKELLREQVFEYQDFSVPSKRNWVFIKNFSMGRNGNHPADNIRSSYSIANYDNVYRHWRLKKSIDKTYSILGATLSETSYEYNGNNHLQVSKKTVTTSDGKSGSETFQYARDLLASGMPHVAALSQKNRFVPLVVQRHLNSSFLSEERLEFFSSHNLLLPKIWTKRNGSEANRIDETISFLGYDNYGNPLEVKKQEGPVTAYLWGYNGQYPIAKIENAGYEEVKQALSDPSGTFLIQLSGKAEPSAADLTRLNNLRSHAGMGKAQITTYTYKPLVGMTSKTDPRGITEYYQYDGFQRLKDVLDFDRNVLENYRYHYRP